MNCLQRHYNNLPYNWLNFVQVDRVPKFNVRLDSFENPVAIGRVDSLKKTPWCIDGLQKKTRILIKNSVDGETAGNV